MDEKKINPYLVGDKVCPICGKKMFRLYWGDYAYKLREKDGAAPYTFFCGYTCMRVVQKKQEEALKAKIAAQDAKIPIKGRKKK